LRLRTALDLIPQVDILQSGDIVDLVCGDDVAAPQCTLLFNRLEAAAKHWQHGGKGVRRCPP